MLLLVNILVLSILFIDVVEPARVPILDPKKKRKQKRKNNKIQPARVLVLVLVLIMVLVLVLETTC